MRACPIRPQFSPLAPPALTTELTDVLQEALGDAYRIDEELAGGGMSRVFTATEIQLERRVVVKVLGPDLWTATSLARFKREIALMVRLQHPHILPILTSGSWEHGMYYITPFISGESLRARLVRTKCLPLDEIIRILEHISSALSFSHAQSVVHRDVKPGNILLAGEHAILADFGIARALSTDGTPLTDSGIVLGTPAYMPPDRVPDERADIYALAVVAYEMLCGQLPPQGVSPKHVLLARGAVAGDSSPKLRGLAALICDVISPRPEGGIRSAQAFSARLSSVSQRRPKARLLAAAACLVVVTAGVATFVSRSTPAAAAERYLVVALGPRDSVRASFAQRIADGLAEWQGVDVVDQRTVLEATGRDSGVAQLSDARRIARSTKASNVVLVDVRRERDSLIGRVVLHTVAGDSSIRSRRVALAAGVAPPPTEIRRLANSILRTGVELPWVAAQDHTNPSINAWRLYDAGREALRTWNLQGAERSLRAAVAADSQVPLARLWLAQTLVWSQGEKAFVDAKGLARRAADSWQSLSTRDSAHASAILSIVNNRFPEACRAFAYLIRTDSSDATGWLGAGDCRALDRVAVPNGPAPGRWVFRGSFESAARAYLAAGEIGQPASEPAFRGWILGRLSSVLYPVTNRIRLGYASGNDTLRLVALPYLDHDSLAFAPYPASELAGGLRDPPPAAVQAAIARNRDLLKRATEDWVRRSPGSAAALDSLASWAEVSGGMATVGERSLKTLDIARRAFALSRDSVQRVRLAVMTVRLLIKNGEFGAARAAGDSLLAAGAARYAADVGGISGVAALLGRVSAAAAIRAAESESHAVIPPDGARLVLPAQLASAASDLIVFTALGIPTDTVRFLARRTLDLIASYYPNPVTAASLRRTLVAPALTFVYPVAADLAAEIANPADATSEAYRRLATKDTSGARAALETIRRIDQGKTLGTSIDGNFRRARLSLALSDTAAAIRELDPVLRALPTLGPSLLSQVTQAASLTRALVLRAEVAAAKRDRATAKECASAVVELWREADPALRPTVERMKVLAQ